MFNGKKLIYCADAGLGSLNIQQFNSMGGRAFIVTQSIKKLSLQIKSAVFNDYHYRLLFNDNPITIKHMKSFDKQDENNLPHYNDLVFKVIDVENVVDVGLMKKRYTKMGKGKFINLLMKAARYVHLLMNCTQMGMRHLNIKLKINKSF